MNTPIIRSRIARFFPIVFVSIFATIPSGCFGGSDVPNMEPAETLRQRFPAQADRVLRVEQTFVAVEQGFTVEAANAQIGQGAWRASSVILPADGSEPIRFRDLNGNEIRVRQVGIVGEGALSERAVAYKRAGGTSFWTAHPQGLEEWLHLEASAVHISEPVAAWEIEGATARMNGDAVELVDEGGVVRVTVKAPVAYALNGREVGVMLSASGARIELEVAADAEEVLVDPIWVSAGSLSTVRYDAAAVLLPNGKVLITGGIGSSVLASTELYDPALNTWTAGAPMTQARHYHTATLLSNNTVLVVGGFNGTTNLASAELYDPVTNTWSAAASMPGSHSQHTEYARAGFAWMAYAAMWPVRGARTIARRAVSRRAQR